MKATVLTARTVNLSPLSQIRAPEFQAAAVLLSTSFVQLEIAYAPTSQPVSDKNRLLKYSPCIERPRPRLYKEHVVSERKVQVLNTVRFGKQALETSKCANHTHPAPRRKDDRAEQSHHLSTGCCACSSADDGGLIVRSTQCARRSTRRGRRGETTRDRIPSQKNWLTGITESPLTQKEGPVNIDEVYSQLRFFEENPSAILRARERDIKKFFMRQRQQLERY
ncbi:unnamed protein product [Fusarium langsethiae]|nr:unnamed protein product [Fusarium langsethiae]